MTDFAFALPPHPACPSIVDRACRPLPAAVPDDPVILTLGRLLNHLDLTPTLALMARIELRGTDRRPRVRGKGITVRDVLRAARRCRTLEEVLEVRPSLHELDVAACLAYDQKVRELRGE